MSQIPASEKRDFLPVRIAVMTVSDSRTEADDKSGRALIERLTAQGHILAEKRITPDNIYLIREAVSRWIAAPDVQAVIHQRNLPNDAGPLVASGLEVRLHCAKNVLGDVHGAARVENTVADNQIESGRLCVLLNFFQQSTLQNAELFVATQIQILLELVLQA